MRVMGDGCTAAAEPRARSPDVSPATPIVFVVDDDVSVRESLELLILSEGWQPETFDSAQAFLARPPAPAPCCLVLDVSLPDLNGLDLQQRVADDRTGMPIVFITGYGDIPMTVRAMKAGALEFLTKPFRDQDLLDAIQLALERDRGRREQEAELAALRERFELLSPREREVVDLVVSGMLNKQIAVRIGTAENTVKVHRSRAMEKMQAQSLADLVKMVDRLRIFAHKGDVN
jgi:RNA polymerase sigma factor (sigma-70 family)